MGDPPRPTGEVDVLVVGAGPTGLTLAAQLKAYGIRFRIIDRHTDRAHESRAVAVQPRTLEVLASLGVTAPMLAAGNQAVRLAVHARDGRVRSVPLFDIGMADTAYPHLLFLSQSETERLLGERLAADGQTIERGVELIDFAPDGDGVTCTLTHPDGSRERIRTAYLAGCDGAHSSVRRGAGIPFTGRAYPQTFVLADVEADGITPGSVHMFMSGRGMLFFFPLGVPATWRLLAMRRGDGPDRPVTLAEVQGLVDAYATGPIRLRDPAWLTDFRVHCRNAEEYRRGRIFLLGDAAHIHSPAGGQGMNVGIQDAVNLGWKLALVTAGIADPALLDTYPAERAPVGREVLRFTDRAFTMATSTRPLIRTVREHLVPRLIPAVLGTRAARGIAFRAVSELDISYADAALATEGAAPPRHGPRAGDRLPDGPLTRDGTATTLHGQVAVPAYHLLLCGPPAAWSEPLPSAVWPVRSPRPGATAPPGGPDGGGLVRVHRIGAMPGPGVLHDASGDLLRRLGVRGHEVAHYLVRPDGHVGYRAGGTDLTGLVGYLNRWLPGRPGGHPAPAQDGPVQDGSRPQT